MQPHSSAIVSECCFGVPGAICLSSAAASATDSSEHETMCGEKSASCTALRLVSSSFTFGARWSTSCRNSASSCTSHAAVDEVVAAVEDDEGAARRQGTEHLLADEALGRRATRMCAIAAATAYINDRGDESPPTSTW